MEVLLNILGDLARLGSIALLLWGMVLCAMLGLDEESRERLSGQRLPASGDKPVRGFADPHLSAEPLAPYTDRLEA